jgi:serine/threonine protein kinase
VDRHLDVGAENAMISEPESSGLGVVKIIDMGLCVDRWEHPPGLLPPLGCVGKSSYMAPEIFLDDRFDEGADIWCLGVMLFMMLFGVPPYRKPHADLCALFREIKAGRLLDLIRRWDMADVASAEAQSLLRRMLSADVSVRPTIPEVLAHPWMAPAVAHLGGGARAAQQANFILEVGRRVNAKLHEQREAAARASASSSEVAEAAVPGSSSSSSTISAHAGSSSSSA